MLKRGGFPGIAAVETAQAIYLKLGGPEGGKARYVKFKEASFAEVAERHFGELMTLLNAYRDPQARLSLAALRQIRRARHGLRPSRPRRRMGAGGGRGDMKPALQDASRRQREASDPQSSAWVSANAGSGKTHVLAQRVIRLLLDGAEPSKLLCLTFTKAAAANMAERVFDRLARWTRLDDAALAEDIRDLGAGRGRSGAGAQIVRPRHRDAGRPEDPDHPRLLRARAASVSVRGQCRRPASARSTSAKRRCCANNRRRGCSRAPIPSWPTSSSGSRPRSARTASARSSPRRRGWAKR